MGETSGDAADFRGFVEARSQALVRTAWLLTGDTHRAEDLVQTALAKTWPGWERVSRHGGGEGLRPAGHVHDVRVVVASPLVR